ncbi:MAG: hypothetical protein EBS61_11440 [Betaproteobacteria bacterium]|nr:hypothetical protein [Betaproteobacteria bacterium]
MTKAVFKLALIANLLVALGFGPGLAATLDVDDVPAPAWSPVPFARPADFAAYMAQRHAWPREKIDALLADYKANAQVIRLMEPPAQSFKRSWQSYRKRFIEPKRVAAGVNFWQENQDALDRASNALDRGTGHRPQDHTRFICRCHRPAPVHARKHPATCSRL